MKSKYYIINSYFMQDLIKEWEKIITRFTEKFIPIIPDDCIYLEEHLAKYSREFFPKDIKINIDNLERFATLCDMSFKLELQADSKIKFDFQPTIHCLGKNLNEYEYSGILD